MSEEEQHVCIPIMTVVTVTITDIVLFCVVMVKITCANSFRLARATSLAVKGPRK